MKAIIPLVLAIVALSSAQNRFLSRLDGQYKADNSGTYSGDDGRYHPDNSGQYRPDNSGAYSGNDGRYYSDSSGQYAGDNSGQYAGSFEKYRHQADIFGGSGGGGGGGSGSGGGSEGAGGRDSLKNTRGGAGASSVFGGIIRRPSTSGSGLGIKRPVGTLTGTLVGSGLRPGSGSGSGSIPGFNPERGSGIGSAGGYGSQVSLKQGSAAGLYDNRNYAIIRKVEQVEEDGYHYLYETENKIFGEEQGKVANKRTKEEVMRARGYFEYTGPDSVVYHVDYTADENGFIPNAAHLPTPPPIPAAILKSLEYQKSIGEL